MTSSVGSTKPSYRYSSFKSASKSSTPSPSSSSGRNDGGGVFSPPAPSQAIVLKNSGEIAARNENKLGSMVRKLMEKKSKPKTAAQIEEDLRKAAAATGLKKDSNLSIIHKKLFQRGGKSGDTVAAKPLTEAKPNARTLAMVLRSERELLDQNRNYESMILDLRSKLEEKDREVEKLKDMCLNQREEIRILKDAVLESHLPNFRENRRSDLQNRASERSAQSCVDEEVLSPKTPAAGQAYNQASIDSPEFSADEAFLEDMNPCLTPCSSNGIGGYN